MATFPPEQVQVIIRFLDTGNVESLGLETLIRLIHKYPNSVGVYEILRVCSSNGGAKKWLRAFNHKGGYESWLKNKTNSQQRQKPLK